MFVSLYYLAYQVNVLSKMRHPNLVTLIGACPEAWVLIYEYLCNGSLEDRLSCKDNTPPLSWQTRIRIATELCSALMFLHSSKPHSIIHGDLKPANVLLDANFVCKLGDFGICRLLSRDEMLNSETLVWRTDNPKGTFAYMDPEFLSSGELTTKSDVYSFGIILLRLLTGRSAVGIAKEVQYAMGNAKLESILDPLAGDWPFVQAEQLARLALRCCDMNRKSRPDLITDVWRVLGPMRASCGGRLSIQLGSAEHSQPPSYFICPIFQVNHSAPYMFEFRSLTRFFGTLVSLYCLCSNELEDPNLKLGLFFPACKSTGNYARSTCSCRWLYIRSRGYKRMARQWTRNFANDES